MNTQAEEVKSLRRAIGVQDEIDAYIKARQKVLEIGAEQKIRRKKQGFIGELSARQWGNACQKKNKAKTKLIRAIERLADSRE